MCVQCTLYICMYRVAVESVQSVGSADAQVYVNAGN